MKPDNLHFYKIPLATVATDAEPIVRDSVYVVLHLMVTNRMVGSCPEITESYESSLLVSELCREMVRRGFHSGLC